MLVRRPTGDVPHDVMVGEGEANPAIGRGALSGRDGSLEMARAELAAEKIEGIGHMQLVVAGRVLGHDLELVLAVADLAHRGRAGKFVEQRPQITHATVNVGDRITDIVDVETHGSVRHQLHRTTRALGRISVAIEVTFRSNDRNRE